VDNEQKRTDKSKCSTIVFAKNSPGPHKTGLTVKCNKLNQDDIVDESKNCQQKWVQHVNRTESNRLPELALQYQPCGKRDVGLPRGWREQDHLKASELHRTGQP